MNPPLALAGYLLVGMIIAALMFNWKRVPPLWAFVLGLALQNLGLTYQPLVGAAHMIGQATIPVVLFVLGMTIYKKVT